jgi:hypothetical protein
MVGRSAQVPALLMLVALLAGCASSGGSVSQDELGKAEQAARELSVEATATTGVIRGVVVDTAIRPIAGATVSLVSNGRNTTTNAAGAFGFDGLAPGAYFLLANKTSYEKVQVSVDVKAGDSDPTATRILLSHDASYVLPHFQAQQFKGFIGCTSSAIAACSLPNSLCGIFGCGNVTDDRYFFTLQVEPHPAFAQSEWVWSATVPSNAEIDFYMEAGDGCASKFFNSTGSHASPSYVTVDGKGFGDPVEGSSTCGIFYRAFGGTTAGLPCPQDLCAGAIVQQDFTLYLHTFYGYRPPAGWRFSQASQVPDPPA